MNAIIMAGGEGTRLRPAFPDAPKPLAPLLGRPVMQRIIELLKTNGITNICVTLRYKPELIESYFGDGSRFGVNIKYSREDMPLGTAGSVAACAEFVGGKDFLVISGDCACDFNLRELMECHVRHGNAVTMALHEYAEPLRFGLVLTDPVGNIRSFIEKPAWERVVTNRVNTGVYVLSPRILNFVPRNTMFDFAKDLFPLLLRRGERMMGLCLDGYWCDIGTPETYYQCNLDALSGKLKIYGEIPTATQKNTAQDGTAQVGIAQDTSQGKSKREIARGTAAQAGIAQDDDAARGNTAQNGTLPVGIARDDCAAQDDGEARDSETGGDGEMICDMMCVKLLCSDRARLMRRMSETLMEAGADFSDGLSVVMGGSKAVVRPMSDECAIVIESDKDELRQNLAELARQADTQ